LLECRYEGVLRQVFGNGDIAHDARQPGNQLRRFHLPHGIDGAMSIGSHPRY
jgi:hypothetical protein